MDTIVITLTILALVFLTLYVVKLKVDNKELREELTVYRNVIAYRNEERAKKRIKKTEYQREYRARKRREKEQLLESNSKLDV